MDRLADPGNTINLIKKYGFTFQKRFGQNFLIDAHVLDRIMDEADMVAVAKLLEPRNTDPKHITAPAK